MRHHAARSAATRALLDFPGTSNAQRHGVLRRTLCLVVVTTVGCSTSGTLLEVAHDASLPDSALSDRSSLSDSDLPSAPDAQERRDGSVGGQDADTADGDGRVHSPLGLTPVADPAFDVSSLSRSTRALHEDFLEVIEVERARFTNPDEPGGYRVEDAWHCPSETRGPSYNAAKTMSEAACRGDEYHLARQLSGYVYSLIYLLRISHDGAILEEISRIFQLARSQLVDECQPRHPTDSNDWCRTIEDSQGRDGYLNWRYLRDLSTIGRTDGVEYVGTDYHKMEEMLIHGMVAAVAWILHENSHLSERGDEYAEQARFWTDYLVNHFEKKWEGRAAHSRRYGQSFSELPDSSLQHPTMRLTAYYWYVSKLLIDFDPERSRRYARESSDRLERLFADDLRQEEGSYLWAHQRDLPTLQMTVYANYFMMTLGDLALDDHPALVERPVLRSLGKTFRQDLFDPSRDGTQPFRVAVGQNRSDSEWDRCGEYRCVTIGGRTFRRYDNEEEARPGMPKSILPFYMVFGLSPTEMEAHPVHARIVSQASGPSTYGARGALAFAAHWFDHAE